MKIFGICSKRCDTAVIKVPTSSGTGISFCRVREIGNLDVLYITRADESVQTGQLTRWYNPLNFYGNDISGDKVTFVSTLVGQTMPLGPTFHSTRDAHQQIHILPSSWSYFHHQARPLGRMRWVVFLIHMPLPPTQGRSICLRYSYESRP
jgi:hypothetical protein